MKVNETSLRTLLGDRSVDCRRRPSSFLPAHKCTAYPTTLCLSLPLGADPQMRLWRRRSAVSGHLGSTESWLSHTALGCLALAVILGSVDALPAVNSSSSPPSSPPSSLPVNQSFTDLLHAFKQWDAHTSCEEFRRIATGENPSNPSLQKPGISCQSLKQKHVAVLVKEWTWLPDNMDNLYSCDCGLTCMWTKSEVLADEPDVVFYESVFPPRKRRKGEPLRVFMNLEAGRKKTGFEDIFISYYVSSHVQVTYAGASFHIYRSYHTSSVKRNDVLVYWSSSRCLKTRDAIAGELLSYLPHHSFGKCLNNAGGKDALRSMYPDCSKSSGSNAYWAYNLQCSMSHYKFVLAIEDTRTDSYVTEKLFYALDAGAIPIYFGAPNVGDLVPPNSIIDGSKFESLERLAAYVKEVAADPVLYAGYHAWRRCGVMGNYRQTRAVSLDSLPCRLCALVSKAGGRNATSFS